MEQDTTNINDLPSNPQMSQQGPPPQQMEGISMQMSPQQPQQQQQMNQIVSDIQQASMQGLTDLPSRDMPHHTGQHTHDEQIKPNYIPPAPSQQYIPQETPQNAPTPPSDIEQYKLPILVGIIFLLFQMPIVKHTLSQNVKQLFNSDGNFNHIGMVVFASLFSATFFFISKTIDIGSLKLSI